MQDKIKDLLERIIWFLEDYWPIITTLLAAAVVCFAIALYAHYHCGDTGCSGGPYYFFYYQAI